MAGVGKCVKLETPFSTFPLFNAGQRGTAPLPRPPNLSKEFLKAIAPQMQVVSVGKCAKLETLFSTFPLFNAG
nr:MAG TPA: hypothetical protein [Caudoviricetes sp.]